jgi:phosphoribosylformylglycinamidine synthase
LSERRNVMGMMPHPERASDALLGSADGRVILESLVQSLVTAAA